MIEDLKKETRVLYPCAKQLEKLDAEAQRRVLDRLLAGIDKQKDLPL